MITIIVLLILAGVAIASLTGDNGILNRAQETRAYNDYFSSYEQVKLAYMSVKTEIMTEKTINSSYKATEHAGDLGKKVENELGGASKGWTVTPTEANATGNTIKIRYTNTSLKKDGIENGVPAQDGHVNYLINLSEGDAELKHNVTDEEYEAGSSGGGSGDTDYSDDVKTDLKVNPEAGTSPWVEYNDEKYKVLYNDDNGIEIIKMENLDSYRYGYNDEYLPTTAPTGYDFNNANSRIANFEKARWSYNNLVENLNKKATALYPNNGIIDDARCVGSVPGKTNKNTKNSTPRQILSFSLSHCACWL